MVGDIDAMITRVLDAAERGDPLDAVALRFLVREYRDGDRGDLGNALGEQLAGALARYSDDDAPVSRADWLQLFAEGSTISDDARLADAARALIAALSAEWPAAVPVGEASVSIEACLSAVHLIDSNEIVPLAIDELERVIGGAYRPGVGVAHAVGDTVHGRGGFADQVHAASALVTAFDITGRLPYSMLAEELMQLSSADAEAHDDVAVMCRAAGVLFRLAALHDDATYRGAAVIAASADYRSVAARMLERVAPAVRTHTDAANYGIALGESRVRPNAGGETP